MYKYTIINKVLLCGAILHYKRQTCRTCIRLTKNKKGENHKYRYKYRKRNRHRKSTRGTETEKKEGRYEK